MAEPERLNPTPEEVAEVRARLNPKRIVKTRLGIIHRGQVPMEEALIDPSKPRPESSEAPDSAVSPAPTKKTTAKNTPSTEKSLDQKAGDSSKAEPGA